MGWVAYGAIGFGAFRLVVEDVQFGNAETLMVSLLFYGLILILLPRLTRLEDSTCEGSERRYAGFEASQRKNQLKSRGADLNDGVGCTSLKG